MGRIEVFTENLLSEGALSTEFVDDIAQKTFAEVSPDTEGELSVVFCDDTLIKELNRKYRGIDAPTDVLSFALREGEQFPAPEDMPSLLGDIIISVPTAERQARSRRHSLEVEIGTLLVHGILHLLGYDDEDEAEAPKMLAAQDRIVSRLF